MNSRILTTLTNLLFPPKCAGCGVLNTAICPQCFSKLAISNVREFPLLANFSYKDTVVQNMVWKLKYRGSKEIADVFAPSMYKLIKDSLDTSQQIILIPIPLSKKRFRSRGFNQSENLANSIARYGKNLGEDFSVSLDAVSKIRETTPQTSLKKAERLKNLENSFEFSSGVIPKNGIVVLIDDITTTGATFREVMRMLKESGVEVKLCVAVAH